jgi:hypothetical protein
MDAAGSYAGSIVLALDVATNTGAAQGKAGGTPILQSLDWRHDKSEDVPALCGRATAWLARRLRDDPPDLVVIEQPIAPAALKGRTTNDTTMTLLPLYGVFCGIVMAKQIPLIPVAISTWRKYALGVGNLKSKDAKAAAVKLCRQLKWTAHDHNAAEAGCIWLWGCSQVAPKLVQRAEPLFLGRGAA